MHPSPNILRSIVLSDARDQSKKSFSEIVKFFPKKPHSEILVRDKFFRPPKLGARSPPLIDPNIFDKSTPAIKYKYIVIYRPIIIYKLIIYNSVYYKCKYRSYRPNTYMNL